VWLGDVLIARMGSPWGRSLVLAYAAVGWVVLYWVALLLSLALFWPVSNLAVLSFVPVTLAVERECQTLAVLGGLYFIARVTVAFVERWRSRASRNQNAG
jgi:hypothetical protein